MGERKSKISIIPLCLILALIFTSCSGNIANYTNGSKTSVNMSSENQSETKNQTTSSHIKRNLDTNLTVDADVTQPAKKEYSTYSMVYQSLTAKELSNVLLKKDSSKQNVSVNPNNKCLIIETISGASIMANSSGINFYLKKRYSTMASIFESYVDEYSGKITTSKNLSFTKEKSAVQNGVNILKSLKLSCTPNANPIVVAMSNKELSTYQTELLNNKKFSKTKAITNLSKDDDAYYLQFSFMKDGLPVYGDSQEPTLYMHVDDSDAPNKMQAQILVTQNGISYLNVDEALSINGESSKPKSIISAEDAVSALKKSYSNIILTKPYTVKKIFPEYIVKQDANTTYENATYTLTPYWCLEVEIKDKEGSFIQGERYNAFTGKDLADGG